jgi:hypothetical protein
MKEGREGQEETLFSTQQLCAGINPQPDVRAAAVKPASHSMYMPTRQTLTNRAHLHHDDGPAVLVQQRAQLGKQHRPPAVDVGEVGWIAGPHPHRAPPNHLQVQAQATCVRNGACQLAGNASNKPFVLAHLTHNRLGSQAGRPRRTLELANQ